METVLFEVKFLDGRIFRVNCWGKNQKKRFRILAEKLKEQIESITELSVGINTVKEFEDIFYI